MNLFSLNEEAAREWLTELVMAHELADLDDPHGTQKGGMEPQIHLAWQPRDPGQEDVVSCLIEQAHDQREVLFHPEHAATDIEFIDDGNDWCYRFLLRIDTPVSVTLASPAREVTHLGDDSVYGVEAAIGVLRETEQSANTLFGQLNGFVAAMIRDT